MTVDAVVDHVILVLEVPAVDVVDVAVAVVVDAIVGNLAGVGEDVGLKIGMGLAVVGVAYLDSRVDDRHDHVGGGGQVPSLGRINIRVRNASHLSGVVHAPLLTEGRIVGEGGQGNGLFKGEEQGVPADGLHLEMASHALKGTGVVAASGEAKGHEGHAIREGDDLNHSGADRLRQSLGLGVPHAFS